MEDLNVIYKGAYTSSLYTSYFDGTSWHGNTKISTQKGGVNPQTYSNPGSVVFNNWLYLIYKDTSSDDLCCTWHDGVQWHGGIKINTMGGGISPQSNFSPQCVVYKGLLYIVYKGPNTDQYYVSYFDGTTWFGNTKIADLMGGIDPKSDYNPGMVVYKSNLYIVYVGTYFHDLYTAYFDGISWYGNTKISNQPGGISPGSNFSPSACVYNGLMYIFYRGSYLKTFYTATFDGSKWAGNTEIKSQPGGISPSSNYSPGVEVFKNKIYLVYKGSYSSSIYTATFDGSKWAGNTTISNQPGGISPGTNYDPSVCVSSIVPNVQPSWMSKLPDSIAIGDINLPGTHDSAAINSSISTPYACHNNSITQQLEYGIRILDVRLKINKNGHVYSFATCHGDLGPNEYQSFPSLLDECRNFLTANDKEVVVMSLKVDDWNGNNNDKSAVYTALSNLLSSYPTTSKKTMPNLGSVRGKIFLYNRINSSLSLGVPIGWADNTSGSYASTNGNRSYKVYIQDQYKELPLIHPNKKKYDLVTAAFGQKKAGEVLINFASATWYGVFGVYIMGSLLNFFGKSTVSQRLKIFGWTMLDFAFNQYNTNTYGNLDIVSIIIASNFNYTGYDKKFKVINDGHDEL